MNSDEKKIWREAEAGDKTCRSTWQREYMEVQPDRTVYTVIQVIVDHMILTAAVQNAADKTIYSEVPT